MTIAQGLLLFVAAMLAGALNSVAGGGSFIAFPALVFTGVATIPANATNTVALWPGSMASVAAYRKELSAQWSTLLPLAAVSILGGFLGAFALLHTPESLFKNLLPVLLLLATLLFAFGGQITKALRRGMGQRRAPDWASRLGMTFFQLLIATYGGYFGGGIGMLMLALLAVMGMDDIHAMNALKTVLASLINAVAVITFVFAHTVVWSHAPVMIAGAILGGYGGARIARKLNPLFVRRFVIAVGFTMTALFFFRR
jgi:uncharacterized membrane protein YfcA